MKHLLIALALTSPLGAQAAEEKVVSNQVRVDHKLLRIEINKGRVSMVSGGSGSMTYHVEFTPDHAQSEPFLSFTKKAPSPQECAECSAAYNEYGGLTIHSGKDYNAIVKIVVPSNQPLNVLLSAGTLDIGPHAGNVDAFLGEGVLEYDSSALPPGVCVRASMNIGTVTNEKDYNCNSVGATLHGHVGTISVK